MLFFIVIINKAHIWHVLPYTKKTVDVIIYYSIYLSFEYK